MATKIKLMRLGKKRAPYYRIVVADARTKRDGRSIETIGKYHPKESPSFIEVDGERAAYWLGVGAQPTDAVRKILKKTGDWQQFKGKAAPEPLQVAEPKADKKAVFEAAALESAAAAGAATTPRKKAAPKKAEEPKAEEPKADVPKADVSKADVSKADVSKADVSKAEEPKADVSKAEEPKADVSKAAEPKADETPAVAAAEAAVEAPAAEAEAPAAEEPAAETASAEQ